MFGIGMPEMILILAIALIVIGPKKLPDLAKSLGRAMREFKKATNEFKETMQIDSEMADVKKAFDDINDEVTTAVEIIPAETDDPAEKTETGENEQDPAKAETEGSEYSDNLKNLKNAYDELNKDVELPGEDETGAAINSEANAADDQKDKIKDEKKTE